MRRIFILFVLAALCSCSKNERLIYDLNMHDIYYPIVTETRDSLFVSLLTADEILTATVEVKLLGDVLQAPRGSKLRL